MVLEYRNDDYHIQVHGVCRGGLGGKGNDGDDDITKEILTLDALRFIGFLSYTFDQRRKQLLDARKQRADEFDSGSVPTFLTSSSSSSLSAYATSVRDDLSWKCASIPNDVRDRRVEITGPVDRKMIINGLNSGASVYMADFEDSTSPTFQNLIHGQINVRDAVRETISYTNPKNGKVYKLNGPSEQRSVLFVRPRGWHLNEAHVTVNGTAMSGSIFDFGLYLFHNAHVLTSKGTHPYYYLPKLENHLEARLWNDLFITAQRYLGIPIGTIRATVLLETITAAFEMEEILYELRDHSLGLNCGRWDYLFSYIKKFRNHGNKITPDRSHLTMTTPLMDSYVKRLIYICHKRNTFAMGGMSASIPIKNNAKQNDIAMKKVEQDKVREVTAGHDGTWVAHPALVPVAKNIFNQHMKASNQIRTSPGIVGSTITEEDLLRLPTNVPKEETITSAGLQRGIYIVLAYTEAWLRGIGCIPLHNAMEDAATAEISRAQIWSWRHHGVITQDDGIVITKQRICQLIDNEVHRQCNTTSNNSSTKGKWKLAGKLVEKMLTREDTLDDFLTSVCYPYIVTTHLQQSPSTSKL